MGRKHGHYERQIERKLIVLEGTILRKIYGPVEDSIAISGRLGRIMNYIITFSLAEHVGDDKKLITTVGWTCLA